MQLLDVADVGTNYTYTWPDGSPEKYSSWVEYKALAQDGAHRLRIGFGERFVYGRMRKRVIVWIDSKPHAEFFGADDFENSGDLVSEVKVPGGKGERICRYPDEPIPERYAGLPVLGLPTRVSGTGVHGAWAVVANISDHRMLATLAALRRLERDR